MALSKADQDKIKDRWNRRFDVDETYINTFVQDANAFADRVKGDYGKQDFSADYLSSLRQTEEDLSSRAWRIQNFFRTHKDSANDEAQKNLSPYLQAFSSPQFSRQLAQAHQQAAAQPAVPEAEERTWLQKGALEEGVNLKNIGRAALGTITDAAKNAGGGLLGIGEKAIDALAWMGNAMAKGQYYQNGGGYNIQADQAFEQSHQVTTKATEELIKKDLYDEQALAKLLISNPVEKVTGVSAETDSVLGEKSDALAQSAGQLLGTAVLQAAGVPWWLTTGATSFGGEAESALHQGATMSEAGLSAAVSAGAEILTEKLSGGIKFGGRAWDDDIVKPFINGISNKVVRYLVNLGVDMAVEGAEEILSGIMGAIGQKLSYMDDKSLSELFTSEQAAESFLGGAILGGAGSVVQSLGAKKADSSPAQEPQGGPVSPEELVDAITPSSENAAPRPQQPAQAQQNPVYDIMDEAIAKATNAPADPVAAAVDAFRANGTVTNKAATDILNSVKAVRQLVAETGVKLPDTASGRRAAVKQAIAQIAQAEAATEQTVSTRPTWETNETMAEYQRRLAEWEKANEAGAFGSVGAATDGFSKPSPVDSLIEQYGEQPTRPGDARYVQVPARDASGAAVSAFVGNAFGSGFTTDAFAETIQKLVASGELGNLPMTNEQSLQNAAQAIVTDGIPQTLAKLQNMSDAGTTSPEAVAEGILLYRFLLESAEGQTGEVRVQTEEMAANLFVSLKHLATAGGRSTQLFSLFRQLSPDGQTRAIAEEIERYVARMKHLRLLPQDYVIPSLTSENPLFREFADASNAEQEATTDADKKAARKRMAQAEDDIYKFIAAQIPATPQNKWDAWRHLSMLGNIKTQARNFISTAAFMPYRAAKQAVGSIIEIAIPQEQRTKAVVGFSAKDRELLAWAKQDRYTSDVDRALRYTARLGETPAAAIIEDNRTIYEQKQLEQVRKFVRNIPAKTDLIFKRAEYASALAGFLKARGYTAQDALSAKVPENVLNEGRQYAVDEAMKATFNDINALSDAAAKMRFNGEGSLSKVGNILLQGAAPYRRTTANLAVRGVEYSPAGLLSGLWASAKKVKDGKITAAQAIDKISAGLTGSTALVLGVALAGGLLGLRIRGGHVPDDEKEAGSQAYSLEFSIDGKTYSYRLDWIGPAAIPLFIGANIRDTVVEAGEDLDASLFAKAVTVGWSTVEPIIDISVLSAIGDTLLDAKYAPDGLEFPCVVANLATNYFTQGVPQLARQLVNAIPANERETKVTGTDAITRSAERMLGNLPVVGQFFKTDKLDEQGNPTQRGSLPERLFDSFVNPGKVSEVDTSVETRNAMQIKKAVSGLDKAFDNLTATFRSGADRQKAVSNLDAAYTVYKQLSAGLRAQIREEQGGRLKYLIAAQDAGLDTDDFATIYQKFYEISNGKGTASEKAQAWAGALQRFQESGIISRKQKSVLQDTMLIWQAIPVKAEKYNAFIDAGLSTFDADWIMKVLDGLKPEADYKGVRPVQEVEAITGSNLSEQQQTQIMDEVLDGASYAKYLKILDQGYSNDDYAAALRIYLDSEKTETQTKKEVTIREFMDDLDLTRSAAEALYKLYNEKA